MATYQGSQKCPSFAQILCRAGSSGRIKLQLVNHQFIRLQHLACARVAAFFVYTNTFLFGRVRLFVGANPCCNTLPAPQVAKTYIAESLQFVAHKHKNDAQQTKGKELCVERRCRFGSTWHCRHASIGAAETMWAGQKMNVFSKYCLS